MRRSLNNAYLIQLVLMLALLALMVYLASRRASPLAFTLVFLAGITLAALPSIYTGYILPRREFRRAERVRQNGTPAAAQVLADGDQVLDEFRRTTMGHKGVDLMMDIPISMQLATESDETELTMKTNIRSIEDLKTGTLVSVRIDPSDPHYVVLDEIVQSV